MTEGQALFEEILHALSPKVLRDTVALPHAEFREEFVPRFLSTSSHDEFLDELGRFVTHVRQRWHSVDIPWDHELAVSEARRLLEATVGEHEAMRAVRHGDRGGLRSFLDTLTRQLQLQALGHYLDTFVLPKIEHLEYEQSIALAEAYLGEFEALPGIEFESPTAIVGRWKEVVRQHAQLALHQSAR